MTIEQQILDYFSVLDESIDNLSQHQEGELTGLPSWVHTTRRITIGRTQIGDGVVIKVQPDIYLEADTIDQVIVNSAQDISQIMAPMGYNGPPLQSHPEDFCVMMGDMLMIAGENPLIPPAIDNRFLVGIGRLQGIQKAFSVLGAKREAIDLWNRRSLGTNSKTSYVHEVKTILQRLESITKRKSFLERRVHRFIHQYRHFLLPPHRRCLFEHPLRKNGSIRKVDFILQREDGLPSMLIELESPVHQVFTKSGDRTAQVNHARRQISEWVSFIETGPATNATGEYGFLTGPKERLVVIGRGLEHRQKLIDTKFDGTVIWTYDLFIDEARRRLNDAYAAQCQLLQMDVQRPI